MLRASQRATVAFRAASVHSPLRFTLRYASSTAAEGAPVTVSVTADGIAVVRFDAPGEKVNTLSDKLMKTFGSVIDTIEKDPKVRAAVLISGKPDSFIAGADIGMLVRRGGVCAAGCPPVGVFPLPPRLPMCPLLPPLCSRRASPRPS